MAISRLVVAFICTLAYTSVQSQKIVYDDYKDYRSASEIQRPRHTDSNIPTTVQDRFKSPKLLSNFLKGITDFCSCVNVPSDVDQMDRWEMDSHGKDLLAYFEPNCLQKRRKPWYIIDGHRRNVINQHELAQYGERNKYQIYSFGPDPNSEMFKKQCIQNSDIAIMGLERLETDGKFAKLDLLANTNMYSDHKSMNLLRQSNNRIHFFAQPYFQDFILASKVSFKCSNILPKNVNFQGSTDIQSVVTSECIMLFAEPDCLGRSTKILPPGASELDTHWESTLTGPNTLSLLYKIFPNWRWTTKSFYLCSDYKANEVLNVDITEFYIDLSPQIKPQVFETYKNVCTCENVPRQVRNLERWSINNHDATMLVYFEENCESNLFAPLWIPAGRSSYSIAVGAFRQINEITNGLSRVLSFGPDQDSHYFKTNCIKLYSTIVKFEIMEENFTERNLEMTAPQTIFRNDSPFPQSETFTASRAVRDLFSVDIGTSLQSMQKVNLQSSFKVENKMAKNQSESKSENISLEANVSASVSGPWKMLGVSLGGSVSGSFSNEHSSDSHKSHEAIIKEGLREAYQNKSTTDNSKKIATVLEETRIEDVSRKLTVPPCSVQVVHAYIKTVENKRIQYRALAKVSGHFGNGNMTYVEVRKFMNDRMQFAGVYDKTTILAYSTSGFIDVEYGVTTLFSVQVQLIPECRERYKLTSSSCCKTANLWIFFLLMVHPVVSFLLKFER